MLCRPPLVVGPCVFPPGKWGPSAVSPLGTPFWQTRGNLGIPPVVPHCVFPGGFYNPLGEREGPFANLPLSEHRVPPYPWGSPVYPKPGVPCRVSPKAPLCQGNPGPHTKGKSKPKGDPLWPNQMREQNPGPREIPGEPRNPKSQSRNIKYPLAQGLLRRPWGPEPRQTWGRVIGPQGTDSVVTIPRGPRPIAPSMTLQRCQRALEVPNGFALPVWNRDLLPLRGADRHEDGGCST